MLVGAVQIGTYDQSRETYRAMGITNQNWNVLAASMTSGIIYSLVTMPFETTKNRMAFQKADPVTGQKLYRTTLQSMRLIASTEGILQLWQGFPPYYLRCGGHTVAMFMAVDWMRKYL